MSEKCVAAEDPHPTTQQGLKITGIDIPFSNIFFLLLQIAVAAIPVSILLGLLGYGLFVLLAALGAPSINSPAPW